MSSITSTTLTGYQSSNVASSTATDTGTRIVQKVIIPLIETRFLKF